MAAVSAAGSSGVGTSSETAADLGQGLDHAVQVPSDGRLGRLGVACAQGLDDLEVLGEGHRGPPGVQGQPELVADVLPAQRSRMACAVDWPPSVRMSACSCLFSSE